MSQWVPKRKIFSGPQERLSAVELRAKDPWRALLAAMVLAAVNDARDPTASPANRNTARMWLRGEIRMALPARWAFEQLGLKTQPEEAFE